MAPQEAVLRPLSPEGRCSWVFNLLLQDLAQMCCLLLALTMSRRFLSTKENPTFSGATSWLHARSKSSWRGIAAAAPQKGSLHCLLYQEHLRAASHLLPPHTLLF